MAEDTMNVVQEEPMGRSIFNDRKQPTPTAAPPPPQSVTEKKTSYIDSSPNTGVIPRTTDNLSEAVALRQRHREQTGLKVV